MVDVEKQGLKVKNSWFIDAVKGQNSDVQCLFAVLERIEPCTANLTAHDFLIPNRARRNPQRTGV